MELMMKRDFEFVFVGIENLKKRLCPQAIKIKIRKRKPFRRRKKNTKERV
jgi:hypothetical protein